MATDSSAFPTGAGEDRSTNSRTCPGRGCSCGSFQHPTSRAFFLFSFLQKTEFLTIPSFEILLPYKFSEQHSPLLSRVVGTPKSETETLLTLLLLDSQSTWNSPGPGTRSLFCEPLVPREPPHLLRGRPWKEPPELRALWAFDSTEALMRSWGSLRSPSVRGTAEAWDAAFQTLPGPMA